MKKILLLSNGLVINADDNHYSKALTGSDNDVYDAYKDFGIHAFDFSRFSEYKKHKEIFKKIRLVEDEEFLKEVNIILNEKMLNDNSLILYVINECPEDILPAYYRLFSNVSLLLDSYLHPNLIACKKEIINGLKRGGCYIINNMNDIEMCCFVVRYCDTQENITLLNEFLCPITIIRIKELFANKKTITSMCLCNVSKIREI